MQQYNRPITMDARELLTSADDLLAALSNGHVRRLMDLENESKFDAGVRLIDDDNPYISRIGYLMLIDSLLEEPEAVMYAIRGLRAKLADVCIDAATGVLVEEEEPSVAA